MSKTLFPTKKIPDYLFDLEYRGPSFMGMMEITALRHEITGLENAIRIITQLLIKHKKIDFGERDVQIFIEAFEKGSFRKKVKLLIKGLDKHPGILSLGMLLILILQIIPQYSADKLKDMSPQLVVEIGDQIKIELLKDEEFLKSIVNMVRPLEKGGDELFCSIPGNNEIIIKYEDKKEFLGLIGEVKEENIEGDISELLTGRIHFANLDAVKRHIGFKINGVGVSIPATLSDELINSTDLKSLLGQWIELEGISTYQKGIRGHINIKKYKIIQQSQMDFSNNISQFKE